MSPRRKNAFGKEVIATQICAQDCRDRVLKSHCARNKANWTITREANEHLMEAMAERMRREPGKFKLRKALDAWMFSPTSSFCILPSALCRLATLIRWRPHETFYAYLRRLVCKHDARPRRASPVHFR